MRPLVLISHILLFTIVHHAVFSPGSVSAQSEEQIRQYDILHKDGGWVTSPARRLAPINKSPENIVVITKQQILDMNAHTVAEILNRAPGLFVNFFGMDMGSVSLIYIEGSEGRNVLFLLDGMRLNFLSSGAAESNMIPVGSIERIEIIRGAASSAWGSALAGVVNIISKRGESLSGPEGMIQSAIGGNNTHDARVEISGREIRLDYFVNAEFQGSDSQRNNREFQKCGLFSKLNYWLSRYAQIGLSVGYSEPATNLGELPNEGVSMILEDRTFFGAATLDIELNSDFHLSLALHHLKHKLAQLNDNPGVNGPAGERRLEAVYDEAVTGAKAKIIFSSGSNTGVLGLDYYRGALDQMLEPDRILQENVAPAPLKTNPTMEEWALYANYTIDLGQWALVPGIRYDWSDATGSFYSPSLGATYQPEVFDETIIRASVGRGFSQPPLSWIHGGALFLDPNPSLDPEEVWSFQAGVESSAFKYLRIKATFFHHDVDKTIILHETNPDQSTSNYRMINDGKIKRQGVELEAETTPFRNFCAWTGFSYVNIKSDNKDGNIYTFNLSIRYDAAQIFRAELFGHHIWSDFEKDLGSNFDDFIWDLNIHKKLWSEGGESITIFFTGHNLFNGSQYVFREYENPGTWFEAGLRYAF